MLDWQGYWKGKRKIWKTIPACVWWLIWKGKMKIRTFTFSNILASIYYQECILTCRNWKKNIDNFIEISNKFIIYSLIQVLHAYRERDRELHWHITTFWCFALLGRPNHYAKAFSGNIYCRKNIPILLPPKLITFSSIYSRDLYSITIATKADVEI